MFFLLVCGVNDGPKEETIFVVGLHRSDMRKLIDFTVRLIVSGKTNGPDRLFYTLRA